MDVQPVGLTLVAADLLRIAWSNGQVRDYSVSELREQCPCATCREKASASAGKPNPFAVLTKSETLPIRIAKMEPMGRYAYAIHFSDGHNTGIYTLERLQELGELVADRP